MSEYSRSLGDAVKKARKQKGLTKKQLADMINVDERTITSIETYKANTTIAVLHPLLRTLCIDPREVFSPENVKESATRYQLRRLLEDCTEQEISTLLSVCDAVLAALRSENGIVLE